MLPEAPLLLERIDDLPLLFHVDDGPAAFGRLIEALDESTDERVAVIGPFALGIGVMHDQAEARAAAGRCPDEHLVVPVGVAEGCNRSAADEPGESLWR